MKVKGLYTKRGWWYWSRMVRGHRVVVALETKERGEAIHKALKLAQRPQLVASGQMEHEISRFITAKVAHNEYSRFSATNKELTLKRFAKDCSIADPRDIKEAVIRKWYDGERKRVAESTAQGYLMTVRSFCAWLVKENIFAMNPAAGIRIDKWEYGHRVKFCVPKVRDKLLKNAKEPMIGFILHAGFEAGLRRNEIVEARPDWFDLQARTIYVRKTDTFQPKDREARAIPMTDVLIAWLKKNPFKGKYCIMPKNERVKSRYRYDFIKPFAAYMKAQGVPWVTPHVMRHTFGSLLAIAGESLLKIARWMGDDHRVTERHYAHLQPGDKSINRLHGAPSDRRARARRPRAKPRNPRPSPGSKTPPQLPDHTT